MGQLNRVDKSQRSTIKRLRRSNRLVSVWIYGVFLIKALVDVLHHYLIYFLANYSILSFFFTLCVSEEHGQEISYFQLYKGVIINHNKK